MAENRFTQYCIKGLEKAYIPSENVFATRRLINGQMVHVRDSKLEYLFTMIALMGLHRAQTQGNKIFLDIDSVYQSTAARIDEQVDPILNIAITAWAGRCIGAKIPSKTAALFHGLIENPEKIKHLGPKALGWLMAACLNGGEEYHEHAYTLAKLAADKYVDVRSVLVRQVFDTFHRNWSPFGSHSYTAYAFLLLARKTGDTWARDIGLRIARKLVQMQGKEGQWAWMYHLPTGRVADFYPVYSVHQYAYAPFFLVEAIDQGYDEFREPLIRGFRWILGHNELGQTMVEPTHQVIWRRMIRTGANSRMKKALRGLATICGVLKPTTEGGGAVQIDYQCHGFEMALPLCVFSGRSDFGEILDDNCFL